MNADKPSQNNQHNNQRTSNPADENSKDNAQTESTLNTPKGKLPLTDSSGKSSRQNEEAKKNQKSPLAENDGTTISVGD